MFRNPLQEVSRRNFNLNKYDETPLKWHNSILTMRTHRGLFFMHFTFNLKCLDKKLDFKETSIQTTKSSPATSLFSHSFIKSGLTNNELSRLVVEPRFWPHNPRIVQEVACIIAFEWSPLHINHTGSSVLAVLNNIGNIDIFEFQNEEWVNVLDLSACLKREFDVGVPNNMEMLEKAVDTIESCAMCWAPRLNDDGSCYFITAQRNSSVYLWSMKGNETLNAEYLGQIQSNCDEITSLTWIEKPNNEMLLIVTNIFGQIFIFQCKINKFELIKAYTIWESKDRMVPQDLHYTMIDNKEVLFCIKHRHLLVLLLDEKHNILSQYINNINDHRITAITRNSEGFFIGTMNCTIYKIKINILNNELDVKLNCLETKDMTDNHEMYGLAFSNNSVLCSIAVIDKQILIRKGSLKVQVIFYTNNINEISEMSFLMNNSVNNIIKLWDCIELLRYKMVKLKTLPDIDFKEFLKDGNTDPYRLKIYLIIVTIWETLEKNLKVSRNLLPQTVEKTQDKIMLLHAQSQIINIKNKFLKNNNLNQLEISAFSGSKKFLEYYCNKYKETLNNDFELNALNESSSFVCQSCDNELNGFYCSNGHINMLCSITFTPIESDYIICMKCKTTASIELYESKPICIFCDNYFSNFI